MRVLANDKFASLDATFDSKELVPSCRNLVYGPETITESILDLFLKLVPYCEQLFKLLHLGSLRAPRPLCQRLHVNNPHLTSPSGVVQKTPSSLLFTGRAVCGISPASSIPQKRPCHQTPVASNRKRTAYGTGKSSCLLIRTKPRKLTR